MSQPFLQLLVAGIITELGIPYIIVSSEIVPLNSHHCPIFGNEPYNTLQSLVVAFVITAAKSSALQGRSSTGTTSSTPMLAPTAKELFAQLGHIWKCRPERLQFSLFENPSQSLGEGRSGLGISAWPSQ